MKLAIVGYGKMGKMIEQLAQKRGHKIIATISSQNKSELYHINNTDVDAAIEFSTPEEAVSNYKYLFEKNIPVVSGTTGWNKDIEFVKSMVEKYDAAFFYASNFSIGVNLFFELNKKLASLMSSHGQFDVAIEEIHHKQKLDAPSGTAISIAEQIIENHQLKTNWQLNDGRPHFQDQDLIIKAKRIDNVYGIHEVKYQSPVDLISISHTALSREGFALGAILAAEWLEGKRGLFSMNDMLQF